MSAKILVLPGMGDIYWTATALQSFIERHDLGIPDVYVWDFDNRPRSLEYVQRIPFVRAAGYWTHHHNFPEFHESYMRKGRAIFPDFQGFDYYLAANGVLRHGGTVEEAFRGYDIDWYFPITQTEAERRYKDEYRCRWSEGYIVAHLSAFGMFSHWVKAWGVEGCARLVSQVQERTGLPVILTGCEWDRPFAETVASSSGAESICGETDLDQFFGLFRGASGCIGWCGGNTIKSVYLKVPTLIVWSRYFKDAGFYKHACPPDSFGKWYRYAVVEQNSPKQVAIQFSNLMSEYGT